MDLLKRYCLLKIGIFLLPHRSVCTQSGNSTWLPSTDPRLLEMPVSIRNFLCSNKKRDIHDEVFHSVHQYWLVVSTNLKNISQIGNLPQVGVKIKMFETTTQNTKPNTGDHPRYVQKSKSNWWLNHPFWKICSSTWIISPVIGVKIIIKMKPPSRE